MTNLYKINAGNYIIPAFLGKSNKTNFHFARNHWLNTALSGVSMQHNASNVRNKRSCCNGQNARVHKKSSCYARCVAWKLRFTVVIHMDCRRLSKELGLSRREETKQQTEWQASLHLLIQSAKPPSTAGQHHSLELNIYYLLAQATSAT